jgi:selenocysteine-specific elongation factor
LDETPPTAPSRNTAGDSIVPIVIGTAGHIDHGKSSLVLALTGTDPDRWQEEKDRGVTIDLGFARFELEDGRSVGIIDVPGHEKFVRNMVAGASGIDLVMLVVAADDGVMPQTREHLAIMQMLGVKRGLVVLTKVDLVDRELVDLAEEDALETMEGTFLEGAPIQRVSSVTGEGIEDLRRVLAREAERVTPRSDGGVFRMPIQRVFTAKGFGTILTGVPTSGTVRVGDMLEVLPGGERGKVRGLQAYHRKTAEARAGHSTAINLTDVDFHSVERGHVVATPGFYQPVRMAGVRLTALTSLDRPLTNRTPVRVHTGTAEVLGEVVLLDTEELAPGDTCLAQLRLEHDLVCAPGDRFVLRLASPVLTLGGGIILEESRHRLKRFKNFVIEELTHQAQSLDSPKGLLESTLARCGALVSVDELAVAVKRPRAEVRTLLGELEAAGEVRAPGTPDRWIHQQALSRAMDRTLDAVVRWFDQNPLRAVMDVRDLRSGSDTAPELLDVVLEVAAGEGLLVREAGGRLRLPGREPDLNSKTSALLERTVAVLEAAGLQPPSPVDLALDLGCPQAELQDLLQLLVDRGEATRISSDLVLGAGPLGRARKAVVANCERNGQLVIPELRDELGTTRKFLIPILEYLDTQGVTIRQGGHRVLKRR